MQIRSKKYGLSTKKKSLGTRRGFGSQEKAKQQLLAEFTVPSQPGNEIEAMQRVARAVQRLPISLRMLERIKTAVAEAVMNAMEHGNHFQAALPVSVQVSIYPKGLAVRVIDQGGNQDLPEIDAPDLEAKLAGLQSPRGWGLFLIQNMVDEMQVQREGIYHIVTLFFYLPDQIMKSHYGWETKQIRTRMIK